MQIVILAGGLGTRLQPLTNDRPKSLVEVAGRPFIEHQLDLLKKNGINDVVLLVGHQGNKIKAALGDGKKFGLSIQYSDEGKKLLGTAGAIKKAAPILQDIFFLMYGDSYLMLDYRKIWEAFVPKNSLALMVIWKNKNQLEPSNIVAKDGRVAIYDKTGRTPSMEYVNEGLSVLRRKSLALIPDGVASQEDFYQELIRKGELLAFETKQRFFEAGSHAGLKELSALLSKEAVAR